MPGLWATFIANPGTVEYTGWPSAFIYTPCCSCPMCRGVGSCGGGYEVVVAELILTAGELLEARTTLASRSALSAHKSHWSRKKEGSDSMSPTGTSRPLSMSVMTRRTQGGGVMGLRSLSPKPHIRARCGCCTTSSEYLYGPLSVLELIFFSFGVLPAALTLPRGAGGASGCCWCITCGGPGM